MPVLPPKVLDFLDRIHLRVPIRTVAFGLEAYWRRLRAPIIRRQIARVVKNKRREIRTTGRKIRVCFVCHDKSTWIYQSVYDAMREDACFEPFVLAVKTWVRNNEQGARRDLVSFFQDRGMVVHTELNSCSLPDVMFLPRFDEFAFQGVFKIRELYRKVLFTGQIYAWITHNCDAYYFGNDDLTYLWKYFMFNDRDADICLRMKKLSHNDIVTVGFARNDEFIKAGSTGRVYWRQDTSYKIIWAPHWSVLTHGRFGNFDRYAKSMLGWLKLHPNVEMVLKPHPMLRTRMTDGVTKERFRVNNPDYREPVDLATVEEYDAFMAEWAAQPNGSVMNSGGYADLFASSDAMVLDSGSFLAEYMFFNKPMCFCNRDRTHEELMQAFNDFGRDLFSGIEVADDFGAVEKFMDDVVRGVDRLKDERVRVREKYLMKNVGHVGEAITRYIREQLKG